jgi:NADH-quinone oxidoreductase subunit L
MFAAAGVSAYGGAMFHLFTHAFFKALLFLSAGSVITAMHHEQDMRKMGGLARALPVTWAVMLIGNLALTGVGIPLLGIGAAGFYSKDAIINATFTAHTGIGTYAFILTVLAAGMTSFYSWRQFLMTFHGRFRGEDKLELEHPDPYDHADGHGIKLSDVHESPWVMLVPLLVLATGALFAGAIFDHGFIGIDASGFWRGGVAAFVGHGAHGELPLWVELAPMALTILGFLIAYYYYILHPELPRQLAARKGMLYTFVYNKWYFDELYDFLFVRGGHWIGRVLWKGGDGRIIDGLGPDGISARVLDATRQAVKLQSGYIYSYALAMLLGVVALATWFLVAGISP